MHFLRPLLWYGLEIFDKQKVNYIPYGLRADCMALLLGTHMWLWYPIDPTEQIILATKTVLKVLLAREWFPWESLWSLAWGKSILLSAFIWALHYSAGREDIASTGGQNIYEAIKISKIE